MLNSRLPTVSLRMNRQSKNAQRLAEALVGHKRLSRVIYPTLFDDPEQKRIFEKQCDFPGGIFSLEFGAARKLRSSSCGTYASPGTRCLWAASRRWPAIRKSTTHSGMSVRELAESGVTDGLVRVSAGIEDWRDLLADFEQALAAIG